MMPRNIEATEQLKNLINVNGSFSTEDAMKLVRLGADPDTKNNRRNSLLHMLSKKENNTNGINDAAIEELVKTYHANIDIQDDDGFTPLQRLMSGLFSTEDAMKLVRLGANPDTKNNRRNSLLHRLSENNTNGINDAAIEELVKMYHANIDIKDDDGFTPLQRLMSGSFSTEAAMKLVRLGADPDTKNCRRNSLLHMLSKKESNTNGGNDAAIEELVKTYHANIDIQDAEGFTPLQHLISGLFSTEAAMKLVRLGADLDTTNYRGDSFLHILSKKENTNGRDDAVIEELDQLAIKYCKERYHLQRNDFLNLLIVLSSHLNNKSSSSILKSLPLEIISYIVSFLDFGRMGKTQQECFFLAQAVFSNPSKIKEMASTPGGINVFQRNNDNKPPIFTFFKSVQTLCHDFEKLKLDLKKKSTHKNPILDKMIGKDLTTTSVKELDKFTEKYAVPYWEENSSLYKRQVNKQKLFNSIKNSEPYNKTEIHSQLKLGLGYKGTSS